MMRHKLYFAGASWAVIGMLGTTPAYAQSVPPSAADTQVSPADIVVTARRRSERLQDTPVSVTAFSGDALEKRNVSDLRELGSFVPNLSLSEAGSNANGAAIYIRGVGQSAPRVTLDPGVGIYVDGVYRQSLNGGFMALLDIERVEILRGPQGTLFGRNTLGGAIRIETRRPDLENVRVRASGAFGSRGRFDVDGSANVPIVKGLIALKIGAAHREIGGYIDRPDGSSLGNENEDALQAQLRFKPSESFDILVSVDHAKSRDLGLTTYAIATNVNATIPRAYNAAITAGRIPGPRYTADLVALTNGRNNGTSPFTRLRFNETGGSVVASLELGDVTLRSFTAYRENDQVDGFDLDGSTLDLSSNDRAFANNQFSQELQINATLFDKLIDFVGGAYYLRSRDTQFATQVLTPGITAIGGADASTSTGADQRLKSFALFGDARFNLSPKFSVSLGLRYVKDDKEVTGTRATAASTRPVTVTQSASDSWSSLSPRILLEYRPQAGLLLYASATKGFKSGGINDTPNTGATPAPLASFSPETLWAYEAGIKSSLFDRRVTINAAAFYSDYRNLQVRLLENTAFGIIRQFVNAGKARSYGFELETTARISGHLRINASGAYLNSRFAGDVLDASGARIFTDGDPLDRSPNWSFTVGAELSSGKIGKGEFFLRGDYGWRDRQFFELAGGANRFSSPAYGLLNASLSYEQPTFTMALYGKNIANISYVTGSLDSSTSSGPTFLYRGVPREVGGRLTVRF